MNDTGVALCYLQLPGNFQLLSLGTLLAFFVLCLNVLTIITVWRTPALHTNANIFIASVALIDMCMALTDITQGIIYSTDMKYDIHEINIIDTVLLGTGFGAITLSCTHMAIIAVDRYIYIAHPFYYILNVTKVCLLKLLLLAWLLGLIYFSIPVIFYRGDKYHEKCISIHPPLVYFIINITLNLIDYIVISICYFKIARLAFKHKKAANTRRLQTANPDDILRQRNNRIAALKSIKFFVVLFGTFFACTFPQGLINGILFQTGEISEYIVMSTMYLFEVHSAVNFFVYVHLNREFSRGLKKQCLRLIKVCFKEKSPGTG